MEQLNIMATYLDGMEGGKHNSDSTETKTYKTYNVKIQFEEIEAKDPLDAAKTICRWLLRDNGANDMVYDVVDEQTKEEFTVDLSEDDENAVLPNKK